MKKETSEDVRKETAVAKFLTENKKVLLVKAKEFSKFDYYICDYHNQLIGLLEIKVREAISINNYKTFYISANKFLDLLYLSRFLAKQNLESVDVVIAVKYLEGIFTYKYRKGDVYQAELSGNKHREKEIVVHIPTSKFKEVKIIKGDFI